MLTLLIDPRGLRIKKIAYFSLLTHANQLLLGTLCHMTEGIGNSKVGRDGRRRRRRRKDRQT